MLRSFFHVRRTPCSSVTRLFGQGKPSNKKKKRKDRRKRLKTIEKEARALHTQEESRRLHLLRLNKLHDAAKWKRLLAIGDETWFTQENMRRHGHMRQYMLRCDGWCPASALRSLYVEDLEYWTTTRTLALAFNCELAGDRYVVKTDRGLWEDCYRQYEHDFGGPIDEEGSSDEDGPATLLDVIEDYKDVSTNEGKRTSVLCNSQPRMETQKRAPKSSTGTSDETEIERLSVDMYEADDDLEYDWKHTDEEDYRMLEDSYVDESDGVQEEDSVEAKYRFALIRHRDLPFQFLRGIEEENGRQLEAVTKRHSYLYDESAPKFGWYRHVPAYDPGLVLNPKPAIDVAGKMESLFGKSKRA